MYSYSVLPGLPQENERLAALKELPTLERLLRKKRCRVHDDRRRAGWDSKAESLGICESPFTLPIHLAKSSLAVLIRH